MEYCLDVGLHDGSKEMWVLRMMGNLYHVKLHVIWCPKVDEKKEPKKQKKLRLRKEKQGMRELWEPTKRKRLDARKEENTPNGWADEPMHHNEALQSLGWWKSARYEPGQLGLHATNLLAALAGIINGIQPIRASPDTQETNYAPPSPPLLEFAGEGPPDLNQRQASARCARACISKKSKYRFLPVWSS
jgi:hypothetical protein